MKKQRLAIIDMGSNSIRLVINLIEDNGSYKELHNFKKVARLSSHLNEIGELSRQGQELIVTTLKQFKQLMTYHQVDRVIGVATAAMRKASNRDEVLSLIKKETGFQIKVLSEYEEAYFGYLAVVNSTSIENGITIDIGGGSTEITRFENRKLLHYHSFPFGAITLQHEFIAGDDATTDELKKLKQYILDSFQTLPWLKEGKPVPVIGIGGSARNLSLIQQRKVGYPLAGLHQYSFSVNELVSVNALLQQTSLNERQSIDGLSKDRADLIVPAAQVITSLVEFTGADVFVMSRKGLRDGLFYKEILSQLDIDLFPSVAEESFYQLSYQYEIHSDHVNQVSKLAASLFKQLVPFYQSEYTNKESLRLLRYSARVVYLGEHINNEASSQHTFYLLTNMTIDGLSHDERLAVALISSFKSKAQLLQLSRPFENLLTKKQLKYYEFLGAVLKLAYCLDRTRRNVISEIGQIDKSDQHLTIPLYYREDVHFEEAQANKHVKHLEKAMKREIVLTFNAEKSRITKNASIGAKSSMSSKHDVKEES
ncbi:Ppx/GppA phosphatase family protein [Halalkalibacterium ligniniphilum]|uniref:Ppx/GppA phosphatase family protein n=1 Tax=Halalkalibacterium ligniniphilum TaxID=1134413 RepID=UPI000377F8AC|nr:Ppx/GppA phosphatase family protein [Halalkalibacterium ligniniphilum]